MTVKVVGIESVLLFVTSLQVIIQELRGADAIAA
jgi:hypothetical protein